MHERIMRPLYRLLQRPVLWLFAFALVFLTVPTHGQVADGGQASQQFSYAPICTPTCGNISWSTTGVPSGITATVSPSVTPYNGTATLTITVGNSTPPGIYSFGLTVSCLIFTCSGTDPIQIYVVPSGTQQIGKADGTCHPGGAYCGGICLPCWRLTA